MIYPIKTISLTILLFLITPGIYCQYFDKSYTLSSTSCCSVQSAGLDFLSVEKNGTFYSTAWASGGLQTFPRGYFRFLSDSIEWSKHLYIMQSASIIGAQSDHSGNTIASGFAYSTFYFDSAQTYSYSNGNFYIKFDPFGNPQWIVARKGKYHVTDKAGGFVSVKNDSTFKHDSNGNITWVKPVGAKNNAIRSYDNDNYYLLDSTVLSKCDTAGNLVWTNNPYTGSKLVADSVENIYVRNGNVISKLDSGGNLIFSRTYPVFNDYTVDKSGNIYVLEKQKVSKFDTTGTVTLWSYTFTAEVTNLKIGVDGNYNVYFAFYHNSYNYTSSGPNPIFIPPNTYLYGTGNGKKDVRSVFALRIKQDSLPVPDSITTGYVSLNARQNLCSRTSFPVPFTVKRYPLIRPFSPYFKVQLSDSSGSFANAIIIGAGNNTPISCMIPDSVVEGDNYRIRVILADSTLIGMPNQNGSLKIRTSPTPMITVTNANFNVNSYYGCTGTPVVLNSNTNINYLYEWSNYSWSWNNISYYPIPGASDSIYSTITDDAYALKIVDSSTACWHYSNPVYLHFSSPLVWFNAFPDSVCIDHLPITIQAYPSGGTFTGNGMYGNMFYPDSTGGGIHQVLYTTSNVGCGVIDSAVTITVDPLLQVSITGLPDTICTNYSPVQINISPSGGVLTGNGISGNYFYPDSAALGINLISYQLINHNGCSDSIAVAIFVDACTGLSEIDLNDLKIFPNPVRDKLYVANTVKKGPYSVLISDYSGRAIFQSENCSVIDMTGFSSGVYVIQVTEKDYAFSRKIVKF